MDEIKLQIVLDDGSIKTGFVNIERKADQSAKNISNSFDGFSQNVSNKLKSIGLAIAAAFTVNKVLDFFKASARAAGEAERATNQLAAALAQVGGLTPNAVAGFQEYANQLQRTTGIQDDLIVQNAALLVSLGNLSGDALKRATAASLNLAQALQIDVGTAFDLVAKASTGNTTALSRYGLKISETIPKNEKFAETLRQIETRFGGLAATRLNTLDGSIQNLSNAFDELTESVGRFFTNSPALRAIINFLSESLFGLADNLTQFANSNKRFLDTVIISIIDFASAVNEYFIKPLELGFNFLRVGILSVKLAFDALAVGLSGFAKLVVEAVVFPIRDIAVGIGNLVSVVNKDLGGKLAASARSLAVDFTQPFQSEFLNTKLIFQDTFAELSKETENTFESKLGSSVDVFLNKLKQVAVNAPVLGNQIKNGIAQPLNELSEKINQTVKQINDALLGALVNIVSQSLQKVGAALVKGGSAFNNFGNLVLGLLGDLAIQIGTLMISLAFSISALATSLKTLNPTTLFIAGAALIAIGGALKALSDTGSGSPTVGGVSGGGVTSEPSPATEISQTQAEPNTQVSVIIQGDVLDSDESGSRIVDLINSAFDKKGVVINQGVLA